MIITSIFRPILSYPLGDSTAGYDSTFMAAGMEFALVRRYTSGLVVGIDVHEDGSKVIYRAIRFADTTGLEQEFLDGTSITILDSALQSLVTSVQNTRVLLDSTNPIDLTVYQRQQVIRRDYTP